MSNDTTLTDRKNEAKAAIEGMHQQVASFVQTDEQFTDFLMFMARLHSYSPSNAMWLQFQWMQRQIATEALRAMALCLTGSPIIPSLPAMTHVAAGSTWKGMGGHPLKGTKALSVLCPVIVTKKDDNGNPVLDDAGQPKKILIGFTLKNRTFDISQWANVEAPKAPVSLVSTEGPESLWDAMVKLAEQHGFTVTCSPVISHPQANGVCNHHYKTLEVRSTLPRGQQIKTLVHEVAHMLMHGTDEVGDLFDPMPRSIKEVEAESVAYTVCNLLGFDTAEYSIGYVSLWGRNDGKLIASTMERVAMTAARIVEFVESGTLPAAKATTKYEFGDDAALAA